MQTSWLFAQQVINTILCRTLIILQYSPILVPEYYHTSYTFVNRYSALIPVVDLINKEGCNPSNSVMLLCYLR